MILSAVIWAVAIKRPQPVAALLKTGQAGREGVVAEAVAVE